MIKRLPITVTTASGLVFGVFGAATAAQASPAQNVSFEAGGGALAHWSHGAGSPIDLTVGGDSGTYALARLHHLDGALPADSPSFATDNYNAGSPRYYITLDNGHSLWGYPSNAGLGSPMAWAIDNGNTYEPWTAATADNRVARAQVTDAYVIADGDQAPGTTNVITDLVFGGNHYN